MEFSPWHLHVCLLLGALACAAAPDASAPAAASNPHVTIETDSQSTDSSFADALTATLPKYNPPKPAPAKKDAPADDLPANGIVHLPAYIVHPEGPPIFRERDLYTSAGLADLALRRYKGLNIGPGWLNAMNKGIGLEMIRDEERLKDMADLGSMADSIQLADPDHAQEIRQAVQETFIHPFDNYIVGPGSTVRP